MLMTIMKEVSLIKLRNSLIRVLALSIFIVFSSCVNNSFNQVRKPYPYQPTPSTIENKIYEVPLAPWEVWQINSFNNEAIRQGNVFSKQGKIEEAIKSYQQGIATASNSEEAENALLLVCSNLLKQGKSSDTLHAITKYATKRGLEPAQLDARFSLLTAYSYVKEGDVNQSLAWFNQAIKSSSSAGKITEESKRAIRQIVRSQTEDAIQNIAAKWKADNTITAFVIEEKERRLRGGKPLSPNSFSEYFSSSHYSLPKVPVVTPPINDAGIAINPTEKTNADIINVSNIKSGVLLPFSGTYSQHAEKVLRGIELALDQYSIKNPIVKVDSSQIGAKQGYINLVKNDAVNIIFGPLLVKDAEEAASIASSYGVPLITFAKKRGLPETSVALFRLGATAENQLEELYKFANQNFNINSLTIMLPNDELGEEFKDSALSINARSGQDKFKFISYNNKTFDSLSASVNQLSSSNPEGVLLLDTPSKIENILREIKHRPELSTLPLFGSAITADPKQIGMYMTILEGMNLVSLFNPYSREFLVTKFMDDYKNKFKEPADLLSAQSYDAAMFALKAFNEFKEGNLAGHEIKALEEAALFLGVTGEIKSLPSGELYRSMRRLKISNGNLVEVVSNQ